MQGFPYAFKVSTYNDHIVLLFSGNTCPMVQELHKFWSSVSVSFVQLFPTHMLSLEFVLEFCHGIAKGGDCNVKINQPFCWIYSMPICL